MKKLTLLLVIVTLAAMLTACGGSPQTDAPVDTPAPVSTPEPQAAPEPTPEPSPEPSPEPTPEPEPEPAITYVDIAGLSFEEVTPEDYGVVTTTVLTRTPVKEIALPCTIAVVRGEPPEGNDGRTCFYVTQDEDPADAVEDGGVYLTYELFDLYTGAVLSCTTDDQVYEGDESHLSASYVLNIDGVEIPVDIEVVTTVSTEVIRNQFTATVPEDYDGLCMVLAYSSQAIESQYEPLVGTYSTLEDYGIPGRQDYRLYRLMDFVPSD